MFVLSARLATAGAVVTVAAKCGVAYPLAHRLPGGDAVVIVIVVLAVTALAATGHEVPTTLGVLAAAAAAASRLARSAGRSGDGRPTAQPHPCQHAPELRALVQRLRDAKDASGKTFEALAKDGKVSESVVRRALAGKAVPPLETVKAITRACGRKEDGMAQAWYAAKAEEVLPGARKLGPKMVTSPREFVESMIFMRIEGGYPPLQQLEKVAGGAPDGRTRLPHSTLHLVLHGQIPPAEELFTAFMEALPVPAAGRRHWLDAHRRLFADAPARRAWGEPPPSYAMSRPPSPRAKAPTVRSRAWTATRRSNGRPDS